jgi:hypothetical protein
LNDAEILAKIAKNNETIKRLHAEADALYGENFRLNRELRERENGRVRR